MGNCIGGLQPILTKMAYCPRKAMIKNPGHFLTMKTINSLEKSSPIKKAAVILIILSIILTLIGGIIPSKKAAKQDPVIALRTE